MNNTIFEFRVYPGDYCDPKLAPAFEQINFWADDLRLAAERYGADAYEEDPQLFSENSKIVVQGRKLGEEQTTKFTLTLEYEPSFYAREVEEPAT